MMDVTVLCSVVDNYGDIGFVYRLCRRLSEISHDISLRLVVDNLESFAFMNSKIDSSKAVQEYNGWKILDWKNEGACRKEFLEKSPQFILQCFQCSRPEWFDDIIFDDSYSGHSHILDVEYLTAEEWADEFHLKKSGTRSVRVKKTIFMPGFTSATGGLVLDRNFMECCSYPNKALEKAGERLDELQKSILSCGDYFKILVFSYPRNFDFLVSALNSFAKTCKKKVHVFLAKGISAKPFEDSCCNRELEFGFSRLPSLNQEQWDSLLCSMDFNFIRGEDSFSRSALSGVPFAWHAYIQDDEFQLVKLKAFLERIRPFLSPEYFETYSRFCFLYNRNYSVEPGDEACQAMAILSSSLPKDEAGAREEMQELALKLLSSAEESAKGFRDSASHFISNGDLAEKLVKFMKDNYDSSSGEATSRSACDARL